MSNLKISRTFLVLILSHVALAFGYRPEADVLFKNPGNPIYQGENTTVLLKIKELAGQNTYFVKLSLYRTEHKEYLAQILFDQSFQENGILKVTKVSDFSLRSLGETQNNNALLFYGFMEMYLSNNNAILIDAFSRMGINFKKSSQSLNINQQRLLEQYMKFVKRRDKNHNLTEKDSPLYSSDPAKQAVLNSILKESFYLNDEKAVLSKFNNQFVWLVENSNLKAYFDQTTRKFMQLEISGSEQNITVAANGNLNFSGQYSFPKYLVFSEKNVPKYEIEFVDGVNMKENINQWNTKVMNWQKIAQQNKTDKTKIQLFPQLVLR